jgi:xanthine dehydrogenase accessory factor
MTVIDRQGSSPGKTGFKMAVASDGSFTGSIGGGVMEHKLVEKSKRLLNGKETLRPFILLQDHDPEASTNRSGMICSGGQTIAFTPLDSSSSETILALSEATEQHHKGILELNESGLSFLPGQVLTQHSENKIESKDKWYYREQIGMPDSLYIFGGGHVGLALSRLFSQLGFQIHIFDNRTGLNTLEANQYAHFKKIVDYQNVSGLIPDGHNVYVVVMTFAHKSDEQVLCQMIGKKVRYLGMMGSKMKVSTIFEHLKQDGFSTRALEKIHAPIGFPINSETPAEIAVSIAAQIIAVKNEAD